MLRKKILLAALLIIILLLSGAVLFFKSGRFKTGKMEAYLKQTRENRPNIVLITLDTLRQDRLGCYGSKSTRTPNLDTLFRDGIGFSNANTCAPITLASHTSILTGLYPTFHGVRDNGLYVLRENVPTITGALKAGGYRTGAFVSAYVLEKKFGLGRHFDVYDDDFSKSILKGIEWDVPSNLYPGAHNGYERRADEVTKAALEWLEKNKDQKFFLWVHYFDPHSPYYEYNGDLSSVTGKAPTSQKEGSFSLEETSRAIKLYDAEVSLMDVWVGNLLRKIEQWGLTGSTLIIAVADHGEGLGEHDYYFEHGGKLYETLLRVPLIVRLPYDGPGGVVIDNLVRTIDIAPTVYDLLGVQPAIKLHGKSLVPLAFGVDSAAPPDSYAETLLPPRVGGNELRSLKTEQYKLIYAPARNGYDLYDLLADPAEMNNLVETEKKDKDLFAGKYKPLQMDLKKRLDTVINTTASGIPLIPENLDEEAKKALKSLGYM
ncbi:sulfatase [Candidatus Poribacteria bacterium]|nr:sulfatase [Candidatus Poribacteria bacterium]